jgi:2-polyprenyl-3-methyl-5-hydroxy-6-metoxy-1,4-benzoquinol methylase
MKPEYDADLVAYYTARAEEYEAIYRRDTPPRQTELSEISAGITELMTGRQVLEIACGTGYWTAIAARTASKIVAIDASAGMLNCAAHKNLPAGRIEFRLADVYDLNTVKGDFNAGLANFWLSHVPRRRLESFINQLHQRLGSGAVVFMADNVYIPGCGGDLMRVSGGEDTYKLRTVASGQSFKIIKNYFTEVELRTLFKSRAEDLRITFGQFYWWLSYKTK